MGSRIRYCLRNLGVVVLVVFGSAFSSASCKAQTYAEIFRQKKTQETYLLKQLTYLKLYAGYVKDGYELVGSGLKTIKGFTSGEFGLHEAFFGSLKLVKPLIKADVRVLEIASMQVKISGAFKGMLKAEIGTENLDYVRSVREAVMDDCNKELDELLMVITASELEMSDEQRLSRLAKVHGSMLDKLGFVLDFYVEVQQLARAQKLEKRSLEEVRRWYEKD